MGIRCGLALLGVAALLPAQPESFDKLLARMDQAAAAFKGMSAKVQRIQHTAVLNENNVEGGTILAKRVKAGDLRMFMDQTEPSPRSLSFQGKKFEIYYPKIETVQEYDVGKHRAMAEQFFLLGFGTPRKDLERDYALRLLGPDTLAGQKTSKLELIPKSEELLKHIQKIELWIAESSGYPLQQKFYQSGGDYQLAVYTNVIINPELPDAALRLKLPKTVKREFPGRQ